MLDFTDVLGLGPTGTFLDFKRDLFTFIQAFITIHVDGREMNENITAALFIDEAITFFVVEPFYNTSSQNMILLFDLCYCTNF